MHAPSRRSARALATLFLWGLAASVGSGALSAQLTPQRASTRAPVELTFPAPRVVLLPSGEPLARGELTYSIQHTFGEVNQGVGTLWGIDAGANIRFSLELGVTDRTSVFLARSSMDRVYELGARRRLLSQTVDGAIPVSLGVQGGVGIQTMGEVLLGADPAFADRVMGSVALPLTRSWEGGLSLALVPMGVRFEATYPGLRLADPLDQTLVGLGIGARRKWGNVVSTAIQLLPVRGLDSETSRLVFGTGLDLETGGHVFQLYLTNSQGLNDAYLLASPTGALEDGGVRFGFNILRSFPVF
jgi:hypothetical protein